MTNEQKDLDNAAMVLAMAIAAGSHMPQLAQLVGALRALLDACILKGAAEPVPFEPGSLDFATSVITEAVTMASLVLGTEAVRMQIKGPTEQARRELLAHSLRAAAIEASCTTP